MKNLWRGAFNYRQSARIEYAHANSKRQAWFIMCRRIAKRDGVDPRVVMGLFDGSKPNFEIIIEMQIREMEGSE